MLNEMLIVLIIVSMAFSWLIAQPRKVDNPLAIEKLQSELIALQTLAMVEKEKLQEGKISFNEYGHINRARTEERGRKKLVFFLGMGKSEIRKGFYDD